MQRLFCLRRLAKGRQSSPDVPPPKAQLAAESKEAASAEASFLRELHEVRRMAAKMEMAMKDIAAGCPEACGTSDKRGYKAVGASVEALARRAAALRTQYERSNKRAASLFDGLASLQSMLDALQLFGGGGSGNDGRPAPSTITALEANLPLEPALDTLRRDISTRLEALSTCLCELEDVLDSWETPQGESTGKGAAGDSLGCRPPINGYTAFNQRVIQDARFGRIPVAHWLAWPLGAKAVALQLPVMGWWWYHAVHQPRLSAGPLQRLPEPQTESQPVAARSDIVRLRLRLDLLTGSSPGFRRWRVSVESSKPPVNSKHSKGAKLVLVPLHLQLLRERLRHQASRPAAQLQQKALPLQPVPSARPTDSGSSAGSTATSRPPAAKPQVAASPPVPSLESMRAAAAAQARMQQQQQQQAEHQPEQKQGPAFGRVSTSAQSGSNGTPGGFGFGLNLPNAGAALSAPDKAAASAAPAEASAAAGSWSKSSTINVDTKPAGAGGPRFEFGSLGFGTTSGSSQAQSSSSFTAAPAATFGSVYNYACYHKRCYDCIYWCHWAGCICDSSWYLPFWCVCEQCCS
ncbi:hypothetical protein VOLCADRAFT_94980 [Volvox carteri f. nagariensis]|uniref:Uncharacterized protein n=1 Tax=Volvox carteri f. nagariensis TaxID=3068 RepID=D8U6A3_VOLCA|nr:uncharacterized protein VOLCADRAFT_94980 [Volvox carteri f. nagariensis]EFJ44678.1 hypothetical protein VOLCADRAFT_94980 [Volvox carteri f. nagariensis]|eukprot:XP_002954254.1 hypothetical protein VOLCADRAFT_94980 [Volvox carteri f. nagariensis]